MDVHFYARLREFPLSLDLHVTASGAQSGRSSLFLGEAPWMAFWPGLAIIALVIGFNLTGDGLNDAFNPRH